ncbi:NPCBM/NEW2 domain-containing protein [Sphingomonas prati]|uniref:Alpha-galactosidase n=1 Tax=Sphingomonas prati TaxID=1843237 RepID=A0A7W9BUD9_9SPHN|nr:NPCBM/NEW2 domain-containing protein [Sphingomonas prati]MBB5730282.1 hypothetical protein [Sphingomonas prati]
MRPIAPLMMTVAFLAAAPAYAAPDPLAPTARWSANTGGRAPVPPMGWNTWNAFNSDIDEEKILASARVLVDGGLAKLGYRNVNIDDGWWQQRRQSDGRLVIRTAKFPSAGKPGSTDTSFRPLTDRIHAMGLRAGIYSDIGRNSCGQIYTPDFKNQPEGSVAEREVGLYGHVDQDIRLFFEEWGFDTIKVDGCGVRGLPADSPRVKSGLYRALPPLIDMQSMARTDVGAVKALYGSVDTALRRYNPDGDYTYSLCLWGSSDVRAWGKDMGNISRTSDDISPHWGRMLSNFDSAVTRSLYAHPGSWNDPDMLFVGTGDFDAAHPVEARSHFSMWAMINAPLFIGYDLRKLTPEQRAIFGNAAVVALNQDPAGNQAVVAYQSDDVQILVKTLAGGGKAVALFNRTASPAPVMLTAAQLKLVDTAPIALTDLWTGARRSFTKEQAFTLKPHETLVFRAAGQRSLANGLYLSEQPGSVNPAADGVVTPRVDPTIHKSVISWAGTRGPGEHPQYAGWGGAQADRAAYGDVLRVATRNYDTGIGVLAGSRLEVRNAGYTRFTAAVGVDDSASPAGGAVRFEVYGDGRKLATSRAVKFGEAAVPLAADVTGVKIVELVARRADGARGDPPAVDWADAALVR